MEGRVKHVGHVVTWFLLTIADASLLLRFCACVCVCVQLKVSKVI